MTFEEFFTKKKINLVQLEKAEPSLFAEFKSHFLLMGEKSFDHTKKFWFNKLRRLYHLSAPEKAITQVETKIASQAKPLSSPTIEQVVPDISTSVEPSESKPVAKPAFRPRNIPVKTEEKKDESESAEVSAEQQPIVKKPAFKPRNIPAAKKDAEDVKSLESRPGENAVSEIPIVESTQIADDTAAKSSYKPKFNLKNLPTTSSVPSESDNKVEDAMGESSTTSDLSRSTDETSARAEAKPAYKPKFNLKNLPKVTPKLETPEVADGQTEITKDIPDSEPKLDAASQATSKPVYKPKFDMKNLPKVDQKNEGDSVKEEISTVNLGVDVDTQTPETSAESIEKPAAKPVYKPKFNLKNLPKVSPEDDSAVIKEDVPPVEQTESTTELSASEVPTEDCTEPPAPKQAYKPRFNMKNIPKANPEKEDGIEANNSQVTTEEVKTVEEDQSPEKKSEEPAISPKQAFKPKFGLRNVTPKPPEE